MLRNQSLSPCGTQSEKVYMDAQYIPPTRRQQLENARIALQKQLAVIEDALAALDAHPDLEEFAETLSRAGV